MAVTLKKIMISCEAYLGFQPSNYHRYLSQENVSQISFVAGPITARSDISFHNHRNTNGRGGKAAQLG
jgi:hypothetical protein